MSETKDETQVDSSEQKDQAINHDEGADQDTKEITSLPGWVGPSLGVVLILGLAGFAFYWWLNVQNAPSEVLDRATTLLDEKKFNDVRVELAKLEGIPEYELHKNVLIAAILVGEGRYGEVDSHLQYLPDDPKMKSVGLLNHGIARFHQQHYEEAIEFLEQAKEVDSSNKQVSEWIEKSRDKLKPAAVLARGMELIKYNDRESFEELINQLEKDPASKAKADFLQGMAFLSMRNLSVAVQYFDKSAEDADLREQSLLKIGQCMVELGQPNEARKAYWKAASENKDCIEAHYWLALYYYDNGAFDWAAMHLQSLTRLLPNDPRPNRMMGYISRDFREFEQAVHHYQEALQRNPRGLLLQQILVELADCLINQKKFEEARAIIDSPPLAKVDDTLEPQRKVIAAQCLASEGHSEQAIKELEEVIGQNPYMLKARLAHGEILLATGNYKKAIDTLEIVVKQDPANFTVYHKLEMAHRRDGNTKRADELKEKADRGVEITTRLSELNSQANKNPDDADVRYELGKLNLEIGNISNARQWFISAVRINPEHKAREELLKMQEPIRKAPDPEDNSNPKSSTSSETKAAGESEAEKNSESKSDASNQTGSDSSEETSKATDSK